MPFKILSNEKLYNQWLSDEAFTRTYKTLSHAISFALEGIDDQNPIKQDLHIIDVDTNEVVFRYTGRGDKK